MDSRGKFQFEFYIDGEQESVALKTDGDLLN